MICQTFLKQNHEHKRISRLKYNTRKIESIKHHHELTRSENWSNRNSWYINIFRCLTIPRIQYFFFLLLLVITSSFAESNFTFAPEQIIWWSCSMKISMAILHKEYLIQTFTYTFKLHEGKKNIYKPILLSASHRM